MSRVCINCLSTTVHGRGNAITSLLLDALSDEKKKGFGVLYWNKKEAISLMQRGGLQLPAGLPNDGFLHSITEPGSPVKPQKQKQTDTDQFKRWFGDSKVVDEDGKPKIMYHGTPYGGFTVFRDWQYFSDSKEYADRYQSPSASSIRGRYPAATQPTTYAVYLSVQKPFDTRDPKVRRIWQNEFFDKYSRTPLSERGLPDWTDGIDLVEFIEDNDLDYDAIILDEGGAGGYGEAVQDHGISVVVRHSKQIKSATDNVGTYDPENPDILYSQSLKYRSLV